MALRSRLIEAVKQYPNLYNTGLDSYKDIALRDKCWLEISQALNETNCELVKREWKILRDSFRQAMNRRKVAKKGSLPKRWRFEKQMSFLFPHMTHRLPDGIKQPYVDPLPDEAFSNADSEDDIEEVFEQEVAMEDPVRTEENTFWTETASASSSQPLAKTEKQEQDELELFFKSLLCTARRLPRNYQIKIKRQLLEVVSKVEEEYCANEQL